MRMRRNILGWHHLHGEDMPGAGGEVRLVKDKGRLKVPGCYIYTNGSGVWFIDPERSPTVAGWMILTTPGHPPNVVADAGGIGLAPVPYTKASVEGGAQSGEAPVRHLAVPPWSQEEVGG